MLKWLLQRRIAAFERSYDYDAGYVREILAADAGAFLAFAKLNSLAQYRKGVPIAAWYAAKLVGILAEDCGPCTQLVVTMAERAGVAPAVLKAILARTYAEMPEDVVVAVRYAEAVLAHDRVDDLRDEIVKRWGRQGLVSLAFAMATARLVPTVKYALGHGQACRRVTVGGQPMALLKQAA
jgi:hypothetical protein